ncbi:MAG: hypothetical protein NXI28_21205 [bacterium]|nr:hypothetical protein [bacterium]
MQISEEYANAYVDLLRKRSYAIAGWWVVIVVVCGAFFGFLGEIFGIRTTSYGVIALPLCILAVHLLVRQQQRRVDAIEELQAAEDDVRSN